MRSVEAEGNRHLPLADSEQRDAAIGLASSASVAREVEAGVLDEHVQLFLDQPRAAVDVVVVSNVEKLHEREAENQPYTSAHTYMYKIQTIVIETVVPVKTPQSSRWSSTRSVRVRRATPQSP